MKASTTYMRLANQLSCRGRMQLLYLLLVGLNLFSLPIKAQGTPGKSTYKLTFKSEPIQEIISLLQDHRGIIWLGTAEGLYFYENNKIQLAKLQGRPISEGMVSQMREDREGVLWMVTEDQGLLLLSNKRDRLISSTQFNVPFHTIGNKVVALEQKRNGDIFLFAHSRLLLYERQQNKFRFLDSIPNLPKAATITMGYSSSEDALYLIIKSKNTYKVYCYKNHSIHLLNWPITGFDLERQNIAQEMTNLTIIQGQKDSLFFLANTRQSKQYLLQIDQKRQCFRPHAKTDPEQYFPAWGEFKRAIRLQTSDFAHQSKEAILLHKQTQSSTGHLLYATNIGLGIVQPSKEHPIHQGLKGQNIQSILGLAEEKLLLSTPQQLLAWNSALDFIYEKWPVPFVKNMLWIEPGTLLLSMENYNGVQKLHLHAQNSTPLPSSTMIDMDYPSPFARVNEGVWTTLDGIEHLYYLSIPKGIPLWKLQLKSSSSAISKHQSARALLINPRDSSLWLAGRSGLYHVLQAGKHPERAIQEIKSIAPALRTTPLSTLYQDRGGRLWIGSQSQGIILYDPLRNKIIRKFTQKDGLSNNQVCSIQGSHQDSLIWVSTKNGLNCIDPYNGQIRSYYPNSEGTDYQFNINASFRGQDGSLYFGGTNGLSYFKPWRPEKNTTWVKPYLEIQIYHFKGKKRKELPSDHSTLVVKPGERYLHLSFHLNPLLYNDQIKYRYKILGLSPDWQVVDSSQGLIYSHFPVGTYHLYLQAKLEDGTWTPTYALTLKVLNYWYKTAWFLACVFLLLGLGARQLYRFRILQLKKEYNIRRQVTADLHDNLSSRLYSIKIISDQIMDTRTKDTRRQGLIERLNKIANDSQQIIRTFLWAFDPRNNTLGALKDKLTSFLHSTIEPLVSGEATLRSPNDLEFIRIDPQVAHHVLMVYQELLSNAVKHTHSTQIYVQVGLIGNKLEIRIDNHHHAIVDKKTEPTKNTFDDHFGLEVLQSRLEKVNGTLEMTEFTAQQSFLLNIPLHNTFNAQNHVQHRNH